MLFQKISLFSLVLLIVAAIDSIRNMPMTALFGSSLIFFFLLAAVIFLIPVSLVSAEFSSRYPEEGGVFHWVRHAFGPRAGALAVWLQWINTMVWYPTILSFIAGTAAYLIDPALAQNRIFLATVILTLFWGLTLANLRGVRASVKINSYCGMIGTLVPMTFLIVLGFGWILSSNPTQVSFHFNDLIPSLGKSENWASLIAIMASFLGMELSAVHVTDIENPQKNFPKALAYSVVILLGTMIFGALAIAVVIPNQDIRLVDGIMQTFTTFFNAFEIPYMIPVLAILIIIGSTGGMINWLISPTKGLLQASEYGFLPPFFAVKNRHGVNVRILVTQALLVTIFCLAFILMPSINAFYWFLTALSTELYMLMYILIFLSALKLKRPAKNPLIYRIPKGIRTFSCLLGLFASVLTIAIGFERPAGVKIGSEMQYASMIAWGNLLMISPIFLLWAYQYCKERSNRS